MSKRKNRNFQPTTVYEQMLVAWMRILKIDPHRYENIIRQPAFQRERLTHFRDPLQRICHNLQQYFSKYDFCAHIFPANLYQHITQDDLAACLPTGHERHMLLNVEGDYFYLTIFEITQNIYNAYCAQTVPNNLVDLSQRRCTFVPFELIGISQAERYLNILKPLLSAFGLAPIQCRFQDQYNLRTQYLLRRHHLCNRSSLANALTRRDFYPPLPPNVLDQLCSDQSSQSSAEIINDLIDFAVQQTPILKARLEISYPSPHDPSA